jgi:hypothetical protein
MTLPMTNDDSLSLSMFLAGALMVFTPMICAVVVLSLWWRKRPTPRGGTAAGDGPPGNDDPLNSRR